MAFRTDYQIASAVERSVLPGDVDRRGAGFLNWLKGQAVNDRVFQREQSSCCV